MMRLILPIKEATQSHWINEALPVPTPVLSGSGSLGPSLA